ncbi:hypothetical protein GCM10023200_27060 [Actinomycetospora chlora]|uniref:Photoactive yellow protein n=1 Tax=Actinomycetospora chlora TaxID=663608 RepID=A0ABP9B4P8_9PSEU
MLDMLEVAAAEHFDELRFGLIVTDRQGVVVGYNRFESERAGIRRDKVVGRDLFIEVAPCVNNYLVAERYHEEDALDEELDYVFTFRVRPTPVRLRLLAAAGSERQYLAIRSR